MSAPLLSVADLSVRLRMRRAPLMAVQEISFDMMRGEILAVVGESGAGKSLIGSAIIGLLEPPAEICGGSIHLCGQAIDKLPSAEMRCLRGRKVAMIFQDPLAALDPLYTVGDHLRETMRVHLDVSRRQAHRRAIELLYEVGISAPEERIDQYPHQLSGGMRQRVMIALAL